MHLAGHLRQALVLLAAFTAIVVRRRFSDKVIASFLSHDSPLTPAAWTFQIDLPLSFAMGLLAVFQALPSMKEDNRLDAIAPYFLPAMIIASVAPFCCVGGDFVSALLMTGLIYRAFDIALANDAWAVQDHAYTFLILAPLGALHAWSLFLFALRTCQLVTAHGITVSAEAAAVVILLISFIQTWQVLESSSSVFAFVSIWAFMGVLSNSPAAHLQPLYAAAALGSMLLVGAVYLRLGGVLPKRFSSSTWGLTVPFEREV